MKILTVPYYSNKPETSSGLLLMKVYNVVEEVTSGQIVIKAVQVEDMDVLEEVQHEEA